MQGSRKALGGTRVPPLHRQTPRCCGRVRCVVAAGVVIVAQGPTAVATPPPSVSHDPALLNGVGRRIERFDSGAATLHTVEVPAVG